MLEDQIKDWEKCNLLLDKIVGEKGKVDDTYSLYNELRKEYVKKYGVRFNPENKPDERNT